MLVSTGGASGAETVTEAVAETAPSVAVTVKGPPSTRPAVKSPEAGSIVPPPSTVHAGVTAAGSPYWSSPARTLRCLFQPPDSALFVLSPLSSSTTWASPQARAEDKSYRKFAAGSSVA